MRGALVDGVVGEVVDGDEVVEEDVDVVGGEDFRGRGRLCFKAEAMGLSGCFLDRLSVLSEGCGLSQGKMLRRLSIDWCAAMFLDSTSTVTGTRDKLLIQHY